jgi:hypothetical protein
MALWQFMYYWTEDEKSPVGDWYNCGHPRIQAAFDATQLILGETEDWTTPNVLEFKVLKDRHIGLGEIRFNLELNGIKRRFRPVGIWPPSGNTFIVLLGCEKSGRIYIPNEAFDLALKYKRWYEQQRGGIREYF